MECDVEYDVGVGLGVVGVEFFYLVGCDVDDVLFYVLVEVFEVNIMVNDFDFCVFVEYCL